MFQSSDSLVTKYDRKEFAFLLHIERGWMLFGGRHELTCRTEALLRPIIYVQVSGDGDAVILQGQVGGLVALVVGAAQGHRRKQVKAYLAVGLGVFNWRAIFGRLQLVCIKPLERIR